MKKHQWAVAAILILAMALSLAGCGNTQKQETEAVPEYVYKPEFSTLEGASGGALVVMAYTEDGAYASCSEKVGREIPEDADVENMTEEDLETYDVYATALYFLGNDGSVTKLPNYTPLPARENTEDYEDFYSQPGLSSLAVDDSGKLIVVEYIYTGWYDGPEGKNYLDDDYYDYYKAEQEVFIRTLDSTGTELKSVPMELGQDQYFQANIVTDDEGNILCGVDTSLLAFDGEGKPAYTIDCGSWLSTVFKLSDGRIYATLWGDSGLSLVAVDCATRSLGKSIPLPNDAYSPIPGGGEYDLCYTSGLNFYGYDLETKTATPLFNWLNCDINSDSISGLHVNSDGSVTGIVVESDLGEGIYVNGSAAYTTGGTGGRYVNQRFTISKQPYDAASQSETLTLACLSLDYNVQDAVIKYNRSGEGPRIEIKDYSEYNTAEDSSAGQQKLLTEMMAGTVADIVCLSDLPYRRIASKGLMADLYPYLDADPELQREDFFPNILSALEVEGGLYGVCPSFYVQSVMGATSVVGDKGTWTYDEFKAALASMPEGCEPFESGVSRGDILRVCVSLDMANYIDWSSRTCRFDSEEFVQLLEFANLFPAVHTDDREESPQSRIQSGQQMLIIASLYSLDDVLYDQSYFGGADVSYIGFPTLSGSGNVLSLENCYGVSADCANKDAAWSFLRSLLTEKYQSQNVWSIPTNLHAYANKLASIMKTTYLKDDNGQYVLDENGDKIKEPRYTMSSDNGPIVNVYAMTKEQADEITAVINATTKAYDYDESIINVVTEEAEAYFAGQKTAQEVASLIQGKMNIYVNEQG